MILIGGEQRCCLKQRVHLGNYWSQIPWEKSQGWERCFAGSTECYWERVCSSVWINRKLHLSVLYCVINSISQESLDLPWGGRKRFLPEVGIDWPTYVEVFAKNQVYKNKRVPLCHNLVLSYLHSTSSQTVFHRASKLWFKTSCVSLFHAKMSLWRLWSFSTA